MWKRALSPDLQTTAKHPTWLLKTCNQSVTLSRNMWNQLSVCVLSVVWLRRRKRWHALNVWVQCAQPLTMRKWMLCEWGEVCVCMCGVCVLPCHLVGLSLTDLVPLSCDIIRAVFRLGQIVLSETQTVWVTDSVDRLSSSQCLWCWYGAVCSHSFQCDMKEAGYGLLFSGSTRNDRFLMHG